MSSNHQSGGASLLRPGLDDGWFVNLEAESLGLNLLYAPLVSLSKAVMALPANPLIAGGELSNSPTGANVYWMYNKLTGLSVAADAGFLSGGAGNGGFTLQVLPNGSWALAFSGTQTMIGYDAVTGRQSTTTQPAPPAGNTVLNVAVNGPASINASAGHITVDGNGSAASPVVGYDTVQGGVGDYMIGGDGTLGAGPAGDGNCALYSASAGSVLVDMQNGNGYGGNAQGNVLVNMNQVRGSFFSNVLIGPATGSDLKSGGNDSLLVSTGGNGFELRPDGSGNVLVSTVGGDVFRFDPAHGWALGDDNIALGFSTAHGDVLDLSLIGSNFHSASAAGYSAATGTGNINDYVSFTQKADGEHLLFSATGHVQTAGIELLDMKLTSGLSVATLYQSHQLLI
jgi:hypothetical protein